MHDLFVPANKNFLIVEQHPVDLLDGVDSSLLSLKVDKAIALVNEPIHKTNLGMNVRLGPKN
jgi:hypothetical protein